ncbi:hypothetical protein [Streptomyces zaomyceticus]|uniref:hypothetical protein n=1 Tax=Streptomyces zaomyceticus TaxID=68286 RepID=UPI00368323C6
MRRPDGAQERNARHVTLHARRNEEFRQIARPGRTVSGLPLVRVLFTSREHGASLKAPGARSCDRPELAEPAVAVGRFDRPTGEMPRHKHL